MNPLLYNNIDKKDILIENNYWFCIFDRFPVSNGHILIIPKIECEYYFDLPIVYSNSLPNFLIKCKVLLDKKFSPDGYNIGVNNGEFAGQTVKQVHIHLIPRYKNDMPDPRGGVRGVIPEKQKYSVSNEDK